MLQMRCTWRDAHHRIAIGRSAKGIEGAPKPANTAAFLYGTGVDLVRSSRCRTRVQSEAWITWSSARLPGSDFCAILAGSGKGFKLSIIVMAGLDPWAFSPRTWSVGIHALAPPGSARQRAWITGSSPVMTICETIITVTTCCL